MSVPYYYIHAGARLRRILRQKEIVILHYAKKAGLTPQGLYRYFSQSIIKKEKLEVLLDAVPMTFNDFLHWDSLEEDSLHQGELLLIYLAQHKIKVKQLADQLQLPVHEMYDWFDSARLSKAQQEQLYTGLALAPVYFTDPRAGKPAVNWEQAYLDKCMEVLQYVRRVNALEKKISAM